VVAEDESLIRLDIVETLTEAGFDVIAAVGDGESAVTKARELRPDVVVMDVKMPQVDGVTAAERIGEDNLAPVVMLTAFSQAEPALGYRDLDLPLPADHAAAVRVRRLRRAVRDPPARGPRQGAAADQHGPERARGFALDPEDLHGSSEKPRARSGPCWSAAA